MSGEEIDLGWAGTLAFDNIDHVAGLLSKLLSGKKCTSVTANEFFKFKPEVETSQRLNRERSIVVSKDETLAILILNDSYGSYGWSTSLPSEDRYDHEFYIPYFKFEHDRVTITSFTQAGSKLYSVFVTERQRD